MINNNLLSFVLSPMIACMTAMMFLNSVAAETYNLSSIEKAQTEIFPTATQFVARLITLTPEQKEAIAEVADLKVRFLEIQTWQALDATGKTLGVVVVDRVVGKHEFIAYAVGITPEGVATAPVILDFRESYGQQIEQAAWRNQFVGKTRHDRLKVGKDIDNISGATLSCVNVTNGIRRMLHTYHIALAQVN